MSPFLALISVKYTFDALIFLSSCVSYLLSIVFMLYFIIERKKKQEAIEQVWKENFIYNVIQERDSQKLLGAMLALGTDREGLEKRLSALVQCPVQILAQKEENRIPEVLVQTVRAENPVFEQAEIWKHITQSTATEKTKTRLFELFSYSRRVLKKEAEFIKGAAVLLALEELGFENFIVSSVTETVGSSEKGPLPGSYLLELIENYQIPMHFVSGKAEKSSPLGMLVLALCKKEGDFPPSACIEKAESEAHWEKLLLPKRKGFGQ